MNARSFSIFSFVILYTVIGFGTEAAKAADNTGNQKSNATWTRRVISQQELERVSQRDMDLSPSVSLRILAKLNARDFDYIAQDIRDGKPIKVPNDFTAFKTWTPLREIHPGCGRSAQIHSDCQRLTLYRLVRKGPVGGGHIYLRRENRGYDQGGPVYRKGKGYKPRVQELSERLWAARANAMGVESLRDCLDTRRGHRERTLLARLHKPADLFGHETVRVGDSGHTGSDCELAGSHTVDFSAKPLQLYSSRIAVQSGRQSCCAGVEGVAGPFKSGP